MSDICSLLQSVSKLCSLCPTFCSLLQSISNLCSLCDFLKAFVVGQLTKQSVSYICILSVIFHSVNDPLGQVTSFFGQISHDTLVVAPSFCCLNVLKSCYLVLFSERKLQKTKKKPAVRKTFCLISPQGEHFRT